MADWCKASEAAALRSALIPPSEPIAPEAAPGPPAIHADLQPDLSQLKLEANAAKENPDQHGRRGGCLSGTWL